MQPFSKPAREWEEKAQGLRQMVGCDPGANLDPWSLAPLVGLKVLDGNTALAMLGTNDRLHLQGPGKDSWSGGIYPYPLPDGNLLCILNPTHPYRRKKATLMEEIAHRHLGHEPTKLSTSSSTLLSVRSFNADIEKEAFGVGAAALAPWSRLFRLIDSGQSSRSIAETLDVTPELINYRINITGAHRLYSARQRTA